MRWSLYLLVEALPERRAVTIKKLYFYSCVPVSRNANNHLKIASYGGEPSDHPLSPEKVLRWGEIILRCLWPFCETLWFYLPNCNTMQVHVLFLEHLTQILCNWRYCTVAASHLTLPRKVNLLIIYMFHFHLSAVALLVRSRIFVTHYQPSRSVESNGENYLDQTDTSSVRLDQEPSKLHSQNTENRLRALRCGRACILACHEGPQPALSPYVKKRQGPFNRSRSAFYSTVHSFAGKDAWLGSAGITILLRIRTNEYEALENSHQQVLR